MRFAASVIVTFAFLAGVAQADELKVKGFNFGQVELGTTVSGEITAESKEETVSWNGAALTALNGNSGWFDAVGVNGCDQAITPDGCTFGLSFRPADRGRFEAMFCFLDVLPLDGCAIVRGQVR